MLPIDFTQLAKFNIYSHWVPAQQIPKALPNFHIKRGDKLFIQKLNFCSQGACRLGSAESMRNLIAQESPESA
jgi:hypothetical protein